MTWLIYPTFPSNFLVLLEVFEYYENNKKSKWFIFSEKGNWQAFNRKLASVAWSQVVAWWN